MYSKYSFTGTGEKGSWDAPFSICSSVTLAGILPWSPLLLLYKPYWCPDMGPKRGASLRMKRWGQSQTTWWLWPNWSLVPELVCILSAYGNHQGQSCLLLYTTLNLWKCSPLRCISIPKHTDACCHPNLKAGAQKCVGRVTSEGLEWQIFR